MTGAAAARRATEAPDLTGRALPEAGAGLAARGFGAAVARGRVAALFGLADGAVTLSIGEAARLMAGGQAAVADLGRAARALLAETPGVPLVAAWDFDPAAPSGGIWAGLPAAWASVPEVDVRWPAADAPGDATAFGRSGERLPLEGVSLDGDPGRTTTPRWRTVPRDSTPKVAFKRRVAAASAAVRAGRLQKVVLCRTVAMIAPAAPDPASMATRLLAAAGPATAFAIHRGGATWIGMTPELLARRRGDRLETEALAGSAPRGAEPAADARIARMLLADPKERREHDLVRAAIVEALEPLTDDLDAPTVPVVRRLSTVQHLSTPVSARLRPGSDLWHAAAALHPTPAVAGTPRDAALAAIRTTEPAGRGGYLGAVGRVEAGGDGMFSIALRCALLRGRRAWLFAGCGIVGDSDPEREWAETEMKLDAMRGVLLRD